MRRIFYLFIVLFLITGSKLLSQIERETRAVWLTTNFRLDWPPATFDPTAQQKNLISIFKNLKRKKLNTIYFQVRSSGTVFFKSSLEPYSYYITGSSKEQPDYDPLNFAIKNAHRMGLELHAWINVIRCYPGFENELLSSGYHVVNKHPDWIMEYSAEGKKSLWLNPGLPEVREYLIDLILELVENYDVDGIHLDFFRYPGPDVDDRKAYELYGNGQNIGDWRRSNLLSIINNLSKRIKAAKPFVKIGVTPFGIYKNINGAVGTEGYSKVYQDSRTWIKNGLVDYLVPQIYWDFNTNPKFDVLAKDWTKNSYGKNIILGIAAYKDEVKPQMDEMIGYARMIGAAGVSFFRYEHIKDYKLRSFVNKAFPSLMPWLDGFNPRPPYNLKYTTAEEMPLKISLTWEKLHQPPDGNGVEYFTLYKMNDTSSLFNSQNLIEIVGVDNQKLTLVLNNPKYINYYFSLKSVDKLWNESKSHSNIVKVSVPRLDNLLKQSESISKPILIKEKDGFKLLLFSEQNDLIKLIAESPGEKDIAITKKSFPGSNVYSIPIEISKYKLLKIVFSKSGKMVKIDL